MAALITALIYIAGALVCGWWWRNDDGLYDWFSECGYHGGMMLFSILWPLTLPWYLLIMFIGWLARLF